MHFNRIERFTAYCVAFNLKSLTDPRGPRYVPIVPAVFLGGEHGRSESEVLSAAWRGLEASWSDADLGPMSSWRVESTEIVPVAQELVVDSGPANRTEYVAATN